MQIDLGDLTPKTAADAWVAPGAFVIGARSNIQDSAVVHTDPGYPVSVGSGVSLGHGAVLHGCTAARSTCLWA
jgi:carbonic anhydrase/acetyltransferase-like protein (isoleucine patch superfamily)